MSNDYKLNYIPVAYQYRGTAIPRNLTLKDCYYYLNGRGMHEQAVPVMAMQNRASDLVLSLAVLISKSGDPDLIARADKYIAEWNDECNDFLNNPPF